MAQLALPPQYNYENFTVIRLGLRPLMICTGEATDTTHVVAEVDVELRVCLQLQELGDIVQD